MLKEENECCEKKLGFIRFINKLHISVIWHYIFNLVVLCIIYKCVSRSPVVVNGLLSSFKIKKINHQSVTFLRVKKTSLVIRCVESSLDQRVVMSLNKIPLESIQMVTICNKEEK